ncbi:hypothetical protein NA57DRAFT_51352 [Rhizodiscina lignyota]|uniref:PQ loop repeat protein n=1 Tax=Rhizodiscina lignyota TaxID=1504668 RepID=A0A9P4MBM3_9PEZI|nr:hypothetical protein NA57DRAFT_51352 [Rhizodiscina lignyota]
MPSTNPNCNGLHHLSDLQFGWTVVVVVGTIVSNIPQQYRLARRRSAEGVSSYFLLTSVMSATCGMANITILSLDIFACCKMGRITKAECLSAVTGVVVNCTQWTCMAAILVIWSVVLPITKWEFPDKPHDTMAHLIWTNVICAVHLVFTFGLFGVLYRFSYHRLTGYANANGVISAIIAALQYAPQIWRTWTLEHIGSISIPWLIVQTPGGLIAMTALVGRPGTNWTTWLGSIGTFIGQVVLLILCCFYAWRERRKRKKEEEEMGIRDAWTWSNWPRKLVKWIFS